jgi:hypothetical protein
MKRVMIVGGGPWQVPIVQTARAMGHTVICTNLHENSPAFKFSHFHEIGDNMIAQLGETTGAGDLAWYIFSLFFFSFFFLYLCYLSLTHSLYLSSFLSLSLSCFLFVFPADIVSF